MNKKFTLKDLRVATKKSMTAEELVERYEANSVEELFEAIEKNFSDAEGLKRRIKKASKSVKPKMLQEEEQSEEIIEESDNSNEISETDNSASRGEYDYSTSFTTEETEKEDRNTILQKLTEKEEELSRQCVEKESYHKELMQKHDATVTKLVEEKTELERLLQTIKEKRERVISLSKIYEEDSEKMIAACYEISEIRESLQKVRKEIKEIKKVYIIVCDDVEIENEDFPELNDNAVREIVSNLSLRSDTEELTVRELKNIAKVRLIVDKFKTEKIEFELLFDNEKVREIFETI